MIIESETKAGVIDDGAYSAAAEFRVASQERIPSDHGRCEGVSRIAYFIMTERSNAQNLVEQYRPRRTERRAGLAERRLSAPNTFINMSIQKKVRGHAAESLHLQISSMVL